MKSPGQNWLIDTNFHSLQRFQLETGKIFLYTYVLKNILSNKILYYYYLILFSQLNLLV